MKTKIPSRAFLEHVRDETRDEMEQDVTDAHLYEHLPPKEWAAAVVADLHLCEARLPGRDAWKEAGLECSTADYIATLAPIYIEAVELLAVHHGE